MTGGSADVVVVGAGLAGLTAADALHAAGVTVAVLEARPSIGGRIKTLVDGEICLDLGATWHWADQTAIRALATELGMNVLPQYRSGEAIVEDEAGAPPRRVALPVPSPAELRFESGAQEFCHRLAARLPSGAVSLGTEVTAVLMSDTGVTVTAMAEEGEVRTSAGAVIVALPPRLAWSGITFDPPLPPDVDEAMQATPTWMATAVKCIAVYESAFWRDDGLSGLAFSRVGPILEVHDACAGHGSSAVLWGFLSAHHDVRDLSPEARAHAVFAQLGRLFGPAAADPLRYVERDWSNDPYTNDEVVWLGEPLPYGHRALTEPLFGGRLLWAGAETEAFGGGHMEAAVRSGQRAAGSVLAR